ncbi:MAG: Spy/CpxP family protein refolding chaperone [Brevinematales bacterium]|nr:Spy/CpxP family protein refolding chaperone [Brevinematales bacterium]
MRRSVWTMVMVSVVGVSMFFGQMGPGMGQGTGPQGKVPGRGMQGISMLTNLTQEQRDKIFAIQQNLRKESVALDTEADQIRYDLHKVMTATSLDEKKAKELYAKLQSVQQKIAQRRFEAELEIFKILTPEQRQQLQNLPPRPGYMGKKGQKW